MLSKENYDKLNTNFLYKREPTWKDNHTNTYWCKNWTFRVQKLKDGRAIMLDTYFNSWDSHRIEVTDQNINEFEVVFDFNEVKRIRDYEADEYDKCDKFRVATDSGGYSCGNLYWVKKDAQKSKNLLIEKTQSEINSLKRELEWKERQLKELKEENKYKGEKI